MALSQFNRKLTVSEQADEQGRGQRMIEVGGPLQIPSRGDYDEHPIRVQFQVVQVSRDAEGNMQIERARGLGEEVAGEQWRGTVELGDLVVGPAKETGKETRGVAIAVLERTNQFAFDTITWCDEVELVAPD